MRNALVPGEALPRGAARERQRRRASTALPGPPGLPAPRTPLPRDRRWPGPAARLYRHRGVTLPEQEKGLPLAPVLSDLPSVLPFRGKVHYSTSTVWFLRPFFQ
ncbi:unnamed protein product [Coccothraustes coccothraustes]